MIRPHIVLATFLVTCSALAAPAPKPQPFVLGWDNPIDPDKDCKIKREKGTLIMEMPGSKHDYDPCLGRFNAPQLLREREIEGDFEMQVRVRIDGQPSVQSTVDGRPSSVSAGFLVILPNNSPGACVRLELRESRKGSGVEDYLELRHWGRHQRQGGKIVEGAKGFENRWKGDAYLRLDRRDGDIGYSISSDGEHWKAIGGIGGIHEKLKVGLAAYSTSTEPSRVVFDQFFIPREHKREPWEFISGWGDAVDPDKDCKINRKNDSLTIEMPGTDHDYDPIRKRFNAPRLLSKLEGKFDLQVRLRIDYRPSVKSTAKGQPSFVSAGFLLIYPETNRSICYRMENAVSQQGTSRGAYANPPLLAEPRRNAPAPKGIEAGNHAAMHYWFGSRGDEMEWDRGKPDRLPKSIWDRGWQNWPLPDKAEHVYLRMEQWEEGASFFISPDGEKWTRLAYAPNLTPKGKLALAAYTSSPHPSKVRFDQIKLWQGKKKER